MSMRMPRQDEIERLRKRYPNGTRVVLNSPLDDPYARQIAGDRATVEGVDDAGQLLCRWDCGSSLSLIPGEDDFRKLTEAELEEEQAQNEQKTEDMNLGM